MWRWSHSHRARTLKRTTFLPFWNTIFAKEFPTIVTLHWINRDLKTNSAYQRILKLFMHFSINDSLPIIPSIVEWTILIIILLGLRRSILICNVINILVSSLSVLLGLEKLGLFFLVIVASYRWVQLVIQVHYGVWRSGVNWYIPLVWWKQI